MDFEAAARASDPLPYPDFLIIGAPKCGTSWLQGALGQHPNIVVVPDEIEYFSSHITKQPVEWYVNLFRERIRELESEKRQPFIVGEKSARYSSQSPDRIRITHHLLPRARLVLMTRDPINRHWAHAKQYFSKPRIAEREGGDVLTVQREKLFDFMRRSRFLGDFVTMVRNWTAAYDPDQLLLVSQEFAAANPRETYDAVLAHVGAAGDYDPAKVKLLRKKRNSGPTIEMPDDVRTFLEGMFPVERQQLQALMGGRGILTARDALASYQSVTANPS
jgi:hypothetical protein